MKNKVWKPDHSKTGRTTQKLTGPLKKGQKLAAMTLLCASLKFSFYVNSTWEQNFYELLSSMILTVLSVATTKLPGSWPEYCWIRRRRTSILFEGRSSPNLNRIIPLWAFPPGKSFRRSLCLQWWELGQYQTPTSVPRYHPTHAILGRLSSHHGTPWLTRKQPKVRYTHLQENESGTLNSQRCKGRRFQRLFGK